MIATASRWSADRLGPPPDCAAGLGQREQRLGDRQRLAERPDRRQRLLELLGAGRRIASPHEDEAQDRLGIGECRGRAEAVLVGEVDRVPGVALGRVRVAGLELDPGQQRPGADRVHPEAQLRGELGAEQQRLARLLEPGRPDEREAEQHVDRRPPRRIAVRLELERATSRGEHPADVVARETPRRSARPSRRSSSRRPAAARPPSAPGSRRRAPRCPRRGGPGSAWSTPSRPRAGGRSRRRRPASIRATPAASSSGPSPATAGSARRSPGPRGPCRPRRSRAGPRDRGARAPRTRRRPAGGGAASCRAGGARARSRAARPGGGGSDTTRAARRVA